MAKLWQRWRGPVLGGVAVWLLSVPLLIAHPTSAASPQVARDGSVRATQRASLAHLQRPQLAQVASRMIAAAVAPLPGQAAPLAAAAAAAQATPAAAAPAAAAPAAAAAAPVRRAAPPVTVGANTILIARLGLRQPVGWYRDCLGRSPVPRWGAWRWSCSGGNNIYVMAHNPGVFTPILNLRAGDIIKYGDPSGRVHTYRVSYTTIVSNTQLWPLAGTAASSLTLQTCWTWDGSRDFIVRAVEI
jgi:sortase family protein